jgi:hypothetical protein
LTFLLSIFQNFPNFHPLLLKQTKNNQIRRLVDFSFSKFGFSFKTVAVVETKIDYLTGKPGRVAGLAGYLVAQI